MMRSLYSHEKRPNWLLRGLIGVSLAIHIVIFLHISGLYNSKALSYIELTTGYSQAASKVQAA